MTVVIDTNILVSAFWSRDGKPAEILSLVLGGELTPCFDYRILLEYEEVLRRPKFHFSEYEISSLLEWIEYAGISVAAESIKVDFIDEADRKFYEVAKTCGAFLITGNLKHFPNDPMVLSAAAFLERFHS